MQNSKVSGIVAVVLCSALVQAAALEVQQSRYVLQAGEPVALAAAPETVEFLLSAASRSVEIDGAQDGGLVVAPGAGGDRLVLAASARLKPGAHRVKLTAVAATGEQREISFDVTLNALPTVPNGATRPPVVLLNGWQTGYTGVCNVAASPASNFGVLAQLLVADGVPVVYLFDNCAEDPNQTVETLGNDLGVFLNSIHYDNGAQVQQIDLVAFSLGGLIARSYLAGLQPQAGLVLTPPANTLVRKLVLIATPNFGSHLAGTYAANLAPGTQSAELIPGSSFLWNLGNWNQRGDDLRGVDAIAVVGNAGAYNATVANASDGLVSLTSASLGFVSQQMSTTRIVPYCQVDPGAFINAALGSYICSAPGIANVTGSDHLTGQIVRSFLAGNKDWMSIGTSPTTDPYLSKDGGVFFAALTAANNYITDITQVTWGTLTLQNGGDSGTIFYDDLTFGTSTYHFTSKSLGSFTSGANAHPAGYIAVTRFKINPAIISVSPLATAPGRVVAAGASLTINGAGFGSQCGSCKVTATPTTASGAAQTLPVTSWNATAIAVNLPASLSGLQNLTVITSSGSDSFPVMVVTGLAAIAAAPTSLQFSYAAGGAVPAAQTVQISNSGSGTLAWTAMSSASWLVATPASGTAPSAVSVSVAPQGLSVGSYSGTLQFSSASNSSVTVTVTLTIMEAPPALVVSPQTLTFQYTSGGAVPAAQSVQISNAGSGTLAWSASDGDSWVALDQASGAAPGTLAVSVNPTALAAGSYASSVQITATGASGSPATIAVTLVVQPAQSAGNITAVLNGASFQPGIAAATWVSVFGTGLAPTTDSWQTSSFVNGALPTSLDGVSVTIDGVPAYVAFISSTQINVLAPDDAVTGAVLVRVASGGVQSNAFTVQEAQFAPAFFTLGGGPYVAAQHADFSVVSTTQPAIPGEVIQLYGTGFGPANPPLPTGQLVTAPSILANDVQVSIGGVAATVQFAGLVGPGLYQLNVTVPQVTSGDVAVTATIGGVQSQMGALLPVGQ